MDCSFPALLEDTKELHRPWQLWQTLSLFSRPMGFGLGPIRLADAALLCQLYGEGLDVFECILMIEGLMLPRLQEPTQEDFDGDAEHPGTRKAK